MPSKIDVREELHKIIGSMRRGEYIIAYEQLVKCSDQMDQEHYGWSPKDFMSKCKSATTKQRSNKRRK